MKDKILGILNSYVEVANSGRDGEYYSEQAIHSEEFDALADRIIKELGLKN